jgi:hypothetical protein
MGQAKRRRQALGFGPDRPVTYRFMTEEELTSIGGEELILERLRSSPGFRNAINVCWLVASRGDDQAYLAVRPVMAQQKFNSWVAVLPEGGQSRAWFQANLTRNHRDINRFLLSSFDVVISNP